MVENQSFEFLHRDLKMEMKEELCYLTQSIKSHETLIKVFLISTQNYKSWEEMASKCEQWAEYSR